MRFIRPLLLLLLVSPSLVKAQVCNPEEILQLMAEKNVINIEDTSFCVDLTSFPNVKVKMAEGSYDLSGQRKASEIMKEQDAAIKNLVGILNSAEAGADGQKFTIQTKGIADGTFNEGTENDATLLAELSTDGANITVANINKVIAAQDPDGAAAIISEIANINKKSRKPEDGPIKFSSIPNDSRLKSLLRNFYLARSRGENLCQSIFGNKGACKSSGETSPELDQGTHCFAGCCDGRRGAIVDIVAPQKDVMSKPGNGTFKPPFHSPSVPFQGKVQMAGSLSVFDLPLKANPELEKAVLEEQLFKENVEADRERFREAMKGSGCGGNDFAVDSVRRIYWTVKSHKAGTSPELYDAIMKNDFTKVYSYYQNPALQKGSDRTVLTALFSGANDNSASFPAPRCPAISILADSWGSDKSFKKCPITETNVPELNGKTVYELSQMSEPKEDEKKTIFLLQDNKAKEVFYYFDSKTNTKGTFKFDYKNENCYVGLSPSYKGGNPSSEKEQTVTCLQKKTGTASKFVDFHPAAPRTGSVVPSDVFNCLNVSKGIDHELANQNPGGSPILTKEAEASQKAYCQVQAGNNLSMNMDLAMMKIGGAAKGKSGFMCTGCSSGVYYDPASKKLNYIARQTNSNGSQKDDPGSPNALAQKSWGQSLSGNDRSLTLASLKSLKSYVIPNCGTSCEDACACLRQGGIEKRIKDKETIVMDFSDVSDGAGGVKKKVPYIGDVPAKDGRPGSYACIFTPPVPHTCSYNPLGGTTGEQGSDHQLVDKCPLAEKLRSLPSNSLVKVTPEKLQKYKSDCGKVAFPSTQDQCDSINGGPMCKKKRLANKCEEPKPKKKVTSPTGTKGSNI